jgi:hypothetical protein
MLTLSCLCGQVRLELVKRPDFIHACNCTMCRKTGARWGYFHPAEVSIAGSTGGYSRADKDDPSAEAHFCTGCGATTHFILTPSAVARFGNGVMGVNMLLADQAELAGVELRYPDGQSWPGQGPFGYVRDPRILGEAPQAD